MNIRRKKNYFDRTEESPEAIVVELRRRVNFREADVMGVAWYGRYPAYFEEASAEIGRLCGLSYKDYFQAKLRAPIVQFHVDYIKPLFLDEEFMIRGSLIWHEGARLNTEYHLIKQDGNLAASGFTVQVFIEAGSWEVCIVPPVLLETCHKRWKAGEFHV